MIDESLQEGFIPLHIAAYNTITNINENNININSFPNKYKFYSNIKEKIKYCQWKMNFL